MEEEEGEYLDDPITLNYNGQVTEIIDLATSSDDDDETPVPWSSYGNRSFSLPVTFFDISSNVALLSKCRPISVKVVDCGVYPPNKPNCKEEIMSDNVSELYGEKPNAESSLDPKEEASCCSPMEVSDRVPKEAAQKNDTTISKKVEHEKEQAVKRKDLSRLDFKKNTGLVGLTITNKIGIKIDLHNKRSKKGKVSEEVMKDIGTTLNNLGTELIPVSNKDISEMPKNDTNESQSNIKPKEALLVSTDAKDLIAKSNKNSPIPCKLKIKLSEKDIKLKKARESHNQVPSKAESELKSKQNNHIANDHMVPKLNLKRKQSDADKNEFYIVDSKNKKSSCGTKNKNRKVEETKKEDKSVKNQAKKDIPPRLSSPIIKCITDINTYNPSKLRDKKFNKKTPNQNRKETCVSASKSDIKCYQKNLQSHTISKNNPDKKKVQSKTSIQEHFSVPVNNKSSSSEGSTTVTPKPDELAKILQERQVHLTKINSGTIQHAESLSGAENGFCVQTHQETPKTNVTKTNDAAIVDPENRKGAKNDSCVRVSQHAPKNKATTSTDAAIVETENQTGAENYSCVPTYQHTPKNKATNPADATIVESENLTGVKTDSSVRTYRNTSKNKVTTPTETTNVNENRVTSRDTTHKVTSIIHKQADGGTAVNCNMSLSGEKEWRKVVFNTPPALYKTVNNPTLNTLFYSNHLGNFKGFQPSPLQTSMHQIQGRPIETMINGRTQLNRQPEANAFHGRPVRFLSPWPPSPFPPPNTNIALNASPRMLRPNSPICRVPSVNNYLNYQIPGDSWPLTPLPPPPLPPPPPPPPPLSLPPQQGTTALPVRQGSKESILGSNADGNLIKKIKLTNTITDKEKMLETLNSEIDQNLDEVTQEPMRKRTDPRLRTKSKPCPLSKKASNNSIEPMIDQKTKDIPISKDTLCNLPAISCRQAVGIMAKNEKFCLSLKKSSNGGEPKIDQEKAIPSYSPPILPTISYQQAFEMIAKSNKQKGHNVFKELTTDTTLTNHSKIDSKMKSNEKGSKEDQAKKISIEEYKKRIKGKHGVDKNNSSKRKNNNVPNKKAVDNNQDLGYDSDSTLVL